MKGDKNSHPVSPCRLQSICGCSVRPGLTPAGPDFRGREKGKGRLPQARSTKAHCREPNRGRTPLTPTAPPVFSRHTRGTHHTRQPKGDVRGGREQAGTDGEGAHLGETKVEGTGASGSPPPRPCSTSTRT